MMFSASAAFAADLELQKFAEVPRLTFPGTTRSDVLLPGPGLHDVIYSLNVINHGPDTATNVQIVDVLPARVTFNSLAPSARTMCTAPPFGGQGTVTCDIPTLASGQSTFLFFTVRLRDDAFSFEPLVNTATVTSSTPDPNLANNTATASLDVEANVPLSREALLAIALAIAVVAVWRLAR